MRDHSILKRNVCAVCALLTGVLTGCDDRAHQPLVYFNGRAVETIADSVFAATSDVQGALLVLRLEGNSVDTIGRGELNSPFHVQFLDDSWYVSDLAEGEPVVVRFSRTGVFIDRIDLAEIGATPHQFAVLPDGRLVVETPNNELVVLTDGGTETFALSEAGLRPSLLVAAEGGVLHAVPDRHITLYNAFGRIRWRQEWPWNQAAFVSDIGVDVKRRIHFIIGVPGGEDGVFRVYSMVASTGEIERWSEAGTQATFVVSPFGEIRADSADRWFGAN